MQMLAVFGVNMGPLLASAGIAGLAIGFGAQTLVRDVINGFFVLLEEQYEVGDEVRIAGVQGRVERMTLRRTVLRDKDGTLHVVPNGQVAVVSNLTRDWAQVTLRITVPSTDSSDRVVRALERFGRELRETPDIAASLVAEPVVKGLDRVSGGRAEYVMVVKTRPAHQYDMARELRERALASLRSSGVEAGAPRTFVSAPGIPAVEVS
jgi:moderate conductance mechanosensitive channel